MKVFSFLFFIAFFTTTLSIEAQNWTLTKESKITEKGVKDIIPQVFAIYEMDDQEMKSLLWSAPKEENVDVRQSNVIINIGLPNGNTEPFRVVRYQMMEPELSSKYDEIRTFYGISSIDAYKSVRIDYTIHGFRAVISSPEGKIFIDHYQRNDKNTRVVYHKKDYKKAPSWGCNVTSSHDDNNRSELINGSRIGDCQLRSYRLAQATTGEYSQFHGGTQTSVMSAVVTAINRINEVYEAEVAVRLILVANTDQIFYYTAATDPYTNNDGVAMLGENQTTCDNVIGNANYDIGHVFSTGGGGVATLQSVCSNTAKARGVTGSGTPVGDPFTIDYVAHEMGHQFGGNHTQYNSCNRNNSTAMEPGSASSIMGYAGICAPNVQSNSDAYFHATSLQEMKTFLLNGGGNCDQIVSSFSNSAPSVTAQPNYTIPRSTPFALTLAATDPNNDPMTFAWDQMNAFTTTQTMPPAATNTSGPVFRSINPSTSPTRYFPNLTTILSGSTANTWEVVPSVGRSMSFRGIARDFTGVAGCNSEINLTVTTVAAAGPFTVTSFNTASTWFEGETKTITWNVAGTTANGINCSNVEILLSFDGGLTYPVTLISSTPNDGSQAITVPTGTTSNARVMVKAIGNIFFDVNNANITIQPSGFNINASPTNVSICQGQSSNINISVASIQGFNSPVTLSLSSLPSGLNGTFTTNPVIPGSNSTLVLTNTNALPTSITVTISGTSGTITKTVVLQVNLNAQINSAPPSPITPDNGLVDVPLKPDFKWSSVNNASSYDIQITRDINFNNIEITVSNASTSFSLNQNLEGLSTYFWRVRGVNNCSTGSWSEAWSFETIPCMIYNASDLPIMISGSGTPTINSYLPISDRGIITDLDVINLQGVHTWISNLRHTLLAPNTSSVIIWNQPCNSEDNFNINFDQTATSSNWPCPPTDGNTYLPSNSLGAFIGLQQKGIWTLSIQDLVNQDGGSLSSWGVKTCLTNFCRLTVSNPHPSGTGSLLAAINCAAAGDTIRFAPSVMNDTILLGNQNLIVDKNLVIEANIANNIHVMSNSTNATIVVNPGINLKIEGLHIHSSNAGIGAINNFGVLTLDDVSTYKWPGTSTSTIQNQAGASTNLIGNCKIISE
ncbi:MAG TPA: zinc-dependent metalloprotease family protein [Saprospiraceae bacterium]|nr:zinc-dependent metalloprotease family protein [Saprospiraceae bacterium]